MSAYLLGLGFRADMGTCIRKLVLLKLIDACEDDGTRIFPAIATIARAAQCSPRQAQREVRAMLDVGLLSLVREGGKGRRSTNEYAMDLAVLGRIAAEGWNAVAGVKGDTVSPLDEDAKGDTDDTDRVTPEASKGDTRSHTTPPDSSPEPSIEREARASERDGQEPDASEKGETPGTADFEKRVARFCSGRGFAAGVWKDWDKSSLGYIGRQFAALSPDDRATAERWRDAYLTDMRRRGIDPQPPGNFLRDKVWKALDPAILQRFDEAGTAKVSQEEPRPDGWAKCLGPVGMAFLFTRLLDGPADEALAARPFLTDPQLRQAWPAVWWWTAMLRQKGGAQFDPMSHRLKGSMEAVPSGSAVLADWRAEFNRRSWRWPPSLDGLDVVFCPSGGPAGLAAFEAAIRNSGNEAAGDDGGEREAAE